MNDIQESNRDSKQDETFTTNKNVEYTTAVLTEAAKKKDGAIEERCEKSTLQILKTQIKNLYTTKGRLNRGAFFKLVLLMYLVGIGLGYVNLVLLLLMKNNLELLLPVLLLGLLIFIGIAVPYCTAHIKRLHDLNKSGLWLLLLVIPLVNIIFQLVLLLKKGTTGANTYGIDPLEKINS